MNIFKKLKLFFIYKKLIKLHKDTLLTYNIRIDKAKRLYTVFNIIDSDNVDVYGKRMFDIRFDAFKTNAEKLFFELRITELVALYDVKKIDNNNYLVIFSFFGFNSVNLYRIITTTIIITIILNILLFSLYI